MRSFQALCILAFVLLPSCWCFFSQDDDVIQLVRLMHHGDRRLTGPFTNRTVAPMAFSSFLTLSYSCTE